jgi:hypothetical protein
MTVLALFDALAREDPAAVSSAPPEERRRLLARSAEQLIAAQLADLDRLGEYERQVCVNTPG